MNKPLLETHPGRWILLEGPRSLRGTLLTFIARLAERGPVRVLDCGNQFNVYQLTRQLRGRRELLERIRIARAFTCHQVLSSLERMVSLPAPLIVLDLLHSFYDESVQFAERRGLLKRGLPHLERLAAQAGGVVSLHRPAVPSAQAEALIAVLQAAAPEAWIQAQPARAPEPWRLF